jgi:hypothetical protein
MKYEWCVYFLFKRKDITMPLSNDNCVPGTRVILTREGSFENCTVTSHVSNPLQGSIYACEGSIIEISDTGVIYVNWDNGSNNIYDPEHLDLAHSIAHSIEGVISDEAWQRPLAALRDVLPDVYGRKEHQRLMLNHKHREFFDEVRPTINLQNRLNDIMASIKERKFENEKSENDVPRHGYADTDFDRRLFNS